MRRTVITRAELHRFVWEKPLRTVAKELGISDVGLSKICKRHGVPTPPQGHWTRVQFGKAVTKGELPRAVRGQAEEIKIAAGEANAPIEAAKDVACPPNELPRREFLLSRETQAEFRIITAENPKNLHPIAIRVQKALKAAKPDDYACVRCSDAALPTVRVTLDAAPRAVALVDALARAAEVRGFGWKAGSGGHWESVASLVIEEIAFPIEIYEMVQRRPHELTSEERVRKAKGTLYWMRSYDYFGTNRFTVRRSEWDQYLKDTKHQKVEDRLDELFANLICRAFKTREERRRRAVADELAAQRAAKQAEIQRLQAIEKKTLEGLHLHVTNWRKAQDLRSLIAAVSASQAPQSETRAQWIGWAAAYAESIDPLCHDLERLLDVDFDAFAALRQMFWENEPEDYED